MRKRIKLLFTKMSLLDARLIPYWHKPYWNKKYQNEAKSIIMNNLRVFVKTSLKEHPLLTNSIIYGSFCTISEFAQQTTTKRIKEPAEPYDTAAITRFAIYGTAIAGPLLHLWYGKILDKMIVGNTLKISLKKLMIDQFTFTPALLGVFYISMSVMERKQDVLEEVKEKFVPTFKTSCMFWMPAQLLNFMMIPPILRVSYIGICSFVWINVLCYMKRQNTGHNEKVVKIN